MKRSNLFSFILLLFTASISYGQFGVTLESNSFPTFNTINPFTGNPEYLGTLDIKPHASIILNQSAFGDKVLVSFYNEIDASTWAIVTDAANGQVLSSQKLTLNFFNTNFNTPCVGCISTFHIKAVIEHPNNPDEVIFTGTVINPSTGNTYIIAGTYDIAGSIIQHRYINRPKTEGVALTLMNNDYVAIIGLENLNGTSANNTLIVARYEFNANNFATPTKHHNINFYPHDVTKDLNKPEAIIISGITDYGVPPANYCGYKNLSRNRGLQLIKYDMNAMQIDDIKSFTSRQLYGVTTGSLSTLSGLSNSLSYLQIEPSPSTNSYFATTYMIDPNGNGASWIYPAIIQFNDQMDMIQFNKIECTSHTNQDQRYANLHQLGNGEFVVTMETHDYNGSFSRARGVGMYQFDPNNPFIGTSFLRLHDDNNGLTPPQGNFWRFSSTTDDENTFFSVANTDQEMKSNGTQYVHLFGTHANDGMCYDYMEFEFPELCFISNLTDRSDDIGTSINASGPLSSNVNAITGDAFFCDGTMSSYRKKSQSLLENSSSIELNMYPNPAKSQLIVELNQLAKDETVNISIFDLTGRLMHRSQTTSSTLTMDVSQFSSGTYILQVDSKSQTLTKKWIKN